MRRYDRRLEWWERRQPVLISEAARKIGGSVQFHNSPRTVQVFDRNGTLIYMAAFRTSGELEKAMDADRDKVATRGDNFTGRQATDLLVDLIRTHHPLYGRQTA